MVSGVGVDIGSGAGVKVTVGAAVIVGSGWAAPQPVNQKIAANRDLKQRNRPKSISGIKVGENVVFAGMAFFKGMPAQRVNIYLVVVVLQNIVEKLSTLTTE